MNIRKALLLYLYVSVFLNCHSLFAQECVQIFYDSSTISLNSSGKQYAILLQNLLGHFPQYQQIVAPIRSYKTHQLNKCKATFYLGSDEATEIPQTFINDFKTTKSAVAWLGFNIQQLGDGSLIKIFGYRFKQISNVDLEHHDDRGLPSFFRDVHYKGEVFYKSESVTQEKVEGSFKMTELELVTPGVSKVIADAVHSYDQRHTPYILKSRNKFFVADIPFTMMSKEDRYLVFADILFDVLQSPPLHPGKHPAVIRIEDVHACANQKNLKVALDVLRELQAPAHIALIPIYADPFHNSKYCKEELLPMNNAPEFLNYLTEFKNAGTTLVLHGITHQSDNRINNRNGVSGTDFEFWDKASESPVPNDGPIWLLNRLDKGWDVIRKSGFSTKIWESPHYAASALDNYIFSRCFGWTIGQVSYFAINKINHLPPIDPALWFENSGLSGSAHRKAAFKNFSLMGVNSRYNQLFPYEIYGDVYGWKVIPEILGRPIGAFDDEVDDNLKTLLERARRNRVLRDSWGSFYFHLSRFSGGEDRKELFKTFIQTMRSYGYEFINLEKFISDKKTLIRPEPIVVE